MGYRNRTLSPLSEAIKHATVAHDGMLRSGEKYSNGKACQRVAPNVGEAMLHILEAQMHLNSAMSELLEECAPFYDKGYISPRHPDYDPETNPDAKKKGTLDS